MVNLSQPTRRCTSNLETRRNTEVYIASTGGIDNRLVTTLRGPGVSTSHRNQVTSYSNHGPFEGSGPTPTSLIFHSETISIAFYSHWTSEEDILDMRNVNSRDSIFQVATNYAVDNLMLHASSVESDTESDVESQTSTLPRSILEEVVEDTKDCFENLNDPTEEVDFSVNSSPIHLVVQEKDLSEVLSQMERNHMARLSALKHENSESDIFMDSDTVGGWKCRIKNRLLGRKEPIGAYRKFGTETLAPYVSQLGDCGFNESIPYVPLRSRIWQLVRGPFRMHKSDSIARYEVPVEDE